MKQSIYFFFALLFSSFICVANATELPRGIITLDNQLADDFRISNDAGEQYQLKQSRGKWVMVHFWASWCGPCRREMPILYRLQQQLSNHPIDIILINTAEDEDTIFSFLGTVAPDIQSFMDKDGELTEKWAPRGLPTTFFIDPQGYRRYLALGGRDWHKPPYQKFINKLLDPSHSNNPK